VKCWRGRQLDGPSLGFLQQTKIALAFGKQSFNDRTLSVVMSSFNNAS
jgi:hypothetical protein